MDYYGIGFNTVLSTIKIAALNTVLFAGNHYINFASNRLQENRLNFDFLEFLTKIVVCPFLEEALFTTLSYHVYIQICSTSCTRVPGAFFYTVSALIFAATHIHMIKDSLLEKLKTLPDSKLVKFKEIAKKCLLTMLFPFIFKIYSSWVMVKIGNFWPCFMLHAYCNYMGGPVIRGGDWTKFDSRMHLGCIVAFFVSIWLFF